MITNTITMDDIISDGVIPFEIIVTYSGTNKEYVLTGTVDHTAKVVTRTDGYPNGGALTQ